MMVLGQYHDGQTTVGKEYPHGHRHGGANGIGRVHPNAVAGGGAGPTIPGFVVVYVFVGVVVVHGWDEA